MQNSIVSLRKSIYFANSQFVRWVSNPRMIMILVFAIFTNITVIQPLTEVAKKTGVKPSVFEPFISVASSGLVLLIFPLMFIVLVSDFPSVYSDSYFSINRIGRKNWLLGQILFGIYSIATYILATFIAVFVFSFTKVKYILSWSNLLEKYYEKNPDEHNAYISSLLPSRLYNQLDIKDALWQSALGLFFYLFLLVLILLVCTLYHKRFLGILLDCSIVAIGTGLCEVQSDFMWFFPMANSITWLHYTEYYRQQIFEMKGSIAYFVITIIVLVSWSRSMVKDYSYEFIQEV